ncbi:unnamed protein product, partial [Musa banksii]
EGGSGGRTRRRVAGAAASSLRPLPTRRRWIHVSLFFLESNRLLPLPLRYKERFGGRSYWDKGFIFDLLLNSIISLRSSLITSRGEWTRRKGGTFYSEEGRSRPPRMGVNSRKKRRERRQCGWTEQSKVDQ